MRLQSAQIENFKLLENVNLDFSTDLKRPLTVIRAENGSGKTSTLQALRWAMWGKPGIPQGMALTSTEVPSGQPVTVQVRVDFTERDIYSGEEIQYRIIRSCTETRGEGDEYHRNPERVRLIETTERGSRDIEEGEGQQSRIRAMLPFQLADVFFTDGDAVQSFIAGPLGSDRQEYVHQAIRHLLGFEEVERAEKLLDPIWKTFRAELRGSGSDDLKKAEEELQKIEDELKEEKIKRDLLLARIEEVDTQIRDDERELDRFKGVGDLEAIQARIRRLEDDIEHLQEEETNIRQQMKDVLQSEVLSRRVLGDKLQAGLAILDELADRNVIPGMSLGLLYDRLELGECICGEVLEEGTSRHNHVRDLIDDHRNSEPGRERLTELRHRSRDMLSGTAPLNGGNGTFAAQVVDIKSRYTACKDRQREKNGDLNAERDRRKLIDEERIRNLTNRLQSSRDKKSTYDRQRGQVGGNINLLEVRLSQQQKVVSDAEKRETLNDVLTHKVDISRDLLSLSQGILHRLESEHVHRVSKRMNQMFLDIEGADTSAEANLYTGVSILPEIYDVIIHTGEERTLNAANELNGANKRVLTLSLIWALMEVAEKEAPRIIDTPIGMTSGSLKERMVDLLTAPPASKDVPYQIVLLLTRSEIRDIEHLLSERSGVITTLSCSKDYPMDLLNDWGVDYPVVHTCECDHTQFCDMCERPKDRGMLRYRGT